MQVSQADVKLFFETVCGEVCDYHCCDSETFVYSQCFDYQL
jgi:hypothetical protein